MRILGIETSCDETAAAVVEDDRILSNVVSSQSELHGRFHGVVPELASRAHSQKIPSVIAEAIASAFPGAGLPDAGSLFDAVAFTRGPGLAGALLVGKVAAHTLASVHELPLLGVNHLEGHVMAMSLAPSAGGRDRLRFPVLALIVSGGHTDLVLAREPGRYRVLGRTRDDAAGEAFDKVARLLGLGYPGGPAIDRAAKDGDPGAVRFPRAVLPGSWDFSFSGLKTAVLYRVQGRPPSGPREVADLAASFQEAAAESLVAKTLAAARRWRVPRVLAAGGVAANTRLRALLAERGAAEGLEVLFPAPDLCTDNAAMIARAAVVRLERGAAGGARACLRVDPSLPMRSWGRARVAVARR